MKIYNKIKKAVKDMVTFTPEVGGAYNFVYRYGIVTSGPREGRVLAFFDADSEELLERYIAILDAKFHLYTDTLADREYVEDEDCWYCTYAVLYPFDTENMSGKFDGQNARPLF